MRQGKLTNEQLKNLVFSRLKNMRDILLRAGVGEDCAALRFGDEACVISTDPVTGATKNIGKIAVHISCNDVASSGAEPEAMLVTLLIPTDAEIKDVEMVLDELSDTAGLLGVDIIGGHTEVTDAVNRIVVSTTVIGRTPADKIVTSGGAKAGDSIIMTGYAAMEGTIILASEHAAELKSILTQEDYSALKKIESLSVVKHGLIAGKLGATAMHDVTEGGVFGAVYELCEASGVGCEVFQDKIPVMDITNKICSFFDINPYRLIGSGSMLITTKEKELIIDALGKSGIKSTAIGRITKKGITVNDKGIVNEMAPPEADELFSI